jgi:hypothetical protein
VTRRANLTAAALLLAGLVSGCGTLTREMYETIYYQQPQREVRKRLGRPDRTANNAWIYVRRRPFRSAAILFEHGRVAGKIWSDSKPIDAEAIEAYRRSLAGKR